MLGIKSLTVTLLVLTTNLAVISARSASGNDLWSMYEKYSKEANTSPDYDKLMHPEFFETKSSSKVNQDELNSEYWMKIGKQVVSDNLNKENNKNVAKNIILFLGDGLSVKTTVATKAYLGDPNMSLSYEKLPVIGMSKTYCVDRQVADSACTSTAYLCGIKGNYATIGVNAKVLNRNCETGLIEENRVSSIAKWAIDAGKGAGIVTTMRVTHASPAGAYSHVADRDWESDTDVKKHCDPTEVDDIAEQLVRDTPGSQFRVILGGGRRNFISNETIDEEGDKGRRSDGVDLIQEWLESKNGKGTYVWNRNGLLNVNASNTPYLLGLFESSHMMYHLESIHKGREEFEPTLDEMTEKAIDILSNEEKGYFLFVEGGLIDHGHHSNAAKKALDETKEFSKAIEVALSKVNLDETLIVVTSDHSHSFSISGYPNRDANIFGYTGTKALDEKDTMILSYGNGNGYKVHVDPKGGRIDPKSLPKPYDFKYPSTLPRDSETHGGDDVGVYAIGPWSYLFTGNFEQVAIPHMMSYAACIGNGLKACDE